MKITDSLLDFMYQNTYKYARQIGIDERDIPSLIFTRKEVLSKPQTVGRRNTRHYFGVYFDEINTVFLNVKHFRTRTALRETIVHELVHKRFPYLSHGREFSNKVTKVLKGKIYPPYKPMKKNQTKRIEGIE